MFQIAFDFDFKEYQSRLQHYKSTNTKPYHFTEEQREEIVEACELMGRASARAVLPWRDPVRDLLLIAYFGAQSDLDRNEMLRRLKALNDVIQDPARKVTFVDGSPRRISIKVNPYNINQVPTPKKPETLQEMEGAEAWVHTLPGGAPVHGAHHVGSGLRIVLGLAWADVGTPRERVGTIYHEFTHKILGTNDFRYGEHACKNLPEQMRRGNADNYCLFIMDFIESKRIW